jgi:hypothetical protein
VLAPAISVVTNPDRASTAGNRLTSNRQSSPIQGPNSSLDQQNTTPHIRTKKTMVPERAFARSVLNLALDAKIALPSSHAPASPTVRDPSSHKGNAAATRPKGVCLGS